MENKNNNNNNNNNNSSNSLVFGRWPQTMIVINLISHQLWGPHRLWHQPWIRHGVGQSSHTRLIYSSSNDHVIIRILDKDKRNTTMYTFKLFQVSLFTKQSLSLVFQLFSTVKQLFAEPGCRSILAKQIADYSGYTHTGGFIRGQQRRLQQSLLVPQSFQWSVATKQGT